MGIEYQTWEERKKAQTTSMVLVSKTEKRAIFLYLLKEGVIVVRKDPYLAQH